MTPLSLRRRSVLAAMVVVATLLTLTSVVVFLALRLRLENDLAEQLHDVIETARALGQSLSGAEFANELQRLGVLATVRTADGQEFVTDPLGTGEVALNGPPEPPGALERAEVDLPAGASVDVAVSRAGVDAALGRLALLQAGAVVVGTLAAAVLASRATRVALRPLDEVIVTAERTTEHATGKRLRPEHTGTEVGRLGAAFDAMLDRLDRALRRAHESDERSRRFLADAAHQLRSPVASAATAAQALLVSVDDAQELEDLAVRIAQETTRAGDLVADLLLLARLDAGEPLVTKSLDLDLLVRREADRVRSLAPRLAVTVTSDASPLTVTGEPRALAEAVANLLDNARRHAQRRVDVTLTREPGTVTVAVADDGPGLPADLASRAFERFASLDGRGGSGLGLPIARDVARAHGGDATWDGRRFLLTVATTPPDEPAQS